MSHQVPPDESPPHGSEPVTAPGWQAWLARLAALGSARLTVGQALLALGVLIGAGGMLGIAFARAGQFRRLSAEHPSQQVDNILTVTLEGSEEARVRVETLLASKRLGEGGLYAWADALDALPPALEPYSPIYVVSVQGEGAIQLHFKLPSDQSAVQPELYRWDEDEQQWSFVPANASSTPGELVCGWVEGPVALFTPEPAVPHLGAVIEPGQMSDPGELVALDLLLVEAGTIRRDGTLDITAQLPEFTDQHTALALIHAPDSEAVAALLSDNNVRRAHHQSMTQFFDEQPWAGVVLDYGAIDSRRTDALMSLIDELADQASQGNKLLALWIPPPTSSAAGWDTHGYDWSRVGMLVDALIVSPSPAPSDYYPGGPVDALLAWATTQVSRTRLYLAFSVLSADEWNGRFSPISYNYALAPLGTVGLSQREAGTALHPQPGQPLTFSLVGQANNLRRDDLTGMYHYQVFVGDGQHSVWIMTASALRTRLDWAAGYGIRGIVLQDFALDSLSPGALEAIQQFRDGQPSSLPATLTVNWQIRDSSGVVLLETTSDLGAPLAWTPDQEGEFVVSADLTGEGILRRGAASILVSEHTDISIGSNVGAPAALPPPVIPAGMPVPVFQPGVAAFGNFELGGQVNQIILHPDQMRQAGMRWVKFQLTWGPGQSLDTAWNYIEQGRNMGFKVLLSIAGGEKYPTEIHIPEYIQFLRDVAYYGPDAIEIWNEPNYYFEWPRGQIDGKTYVRDMLAPAYNAIKEVNPNIIVISGALLPTGLYYSEGGCSSQGYGCDDWFYLRQMAEMGAGNYMDCVGVHYNAGATPPSAVSGHPADPGYQHYSWYFGSMLQLYGGTFGHPVCFTELGYLSPEGYGGLPNQFRWASDTTVAHQAAWLAEAAQISRQSGQVRLMIVWNVDFDYWGADDPKAGYAIVRPDGGCPACVALDNVMP